MSDVTNPSPELQGDAAANQGLAELRSCPWCGARNRGDILDIYPASPSLGQSKWRVVCDDCGAEGPTVPAYNADDPDELCQRAWNTRAADAELDRLRAENERLREGESILIGWHDFITGPDEMGDHIRERRLIEAMRKYVAALGEQP